MFTESSFANQSDVASWTVGASEAELRCGNSGSPKQSAVDAAEAFADLVAKVDVWTSVWVSEDPELDPEEDVCDDDFVEVDLLQTGRKQARTTSFDREMRAQAGPPRQAAAPQKCSAAY